MTLAVDDKWVKVIEEDTTWVDAALMTEFKTTQSVKKTRPNLEICFRKIAHPATYNTMTLAVANRRVKVIEEDTTWVDAAMTPPMGNI